MKYLLTGRTKKEQKKKKGRKRKKKKKKEKKKKKKKLSDNSYADPYYIFYDCRLTDELRWT